MAAYDVLFPVRPRVLERFSREEIELAARVAFWQHPPDDCTVPLQGLTMEWTEDLLGSDTMMIRVSGDVVPPVPWAPDSVPPPVVPGEDDPIRVTKLDDLRRGTPALPRRRK